MMKVNNIIFSGALLAALCMAVSCTDTLGIEDKAVQDEITFEPAALSASTKAGTGIITGTEFPEDEIFDVSCVFLPNRDSEGHAIYTGAQPLFAATPVTRDAVSNTWKSEDRYYWPLTGGMKFLSFYPTSSVLTERKMFTGITVNPADYSGSYLGYKIHHTDDTFNDITDETLKTEDNLPNARIDFMTSTYFMDDIEKRSGNAVPVVFSHNLTQLRFKVKAEKDFSTCEYYAADQTVVPKETAATDDASWDHANVNHVRIWVDRIELDNIYSIADYTTNAPNWNSNLRDTYRYVLLSKAEMGGTNAEYQTPGKDASSDVYEDRHYFGDRTPVAVPVKLSESEELAVLMIPQTLDPAATLKITYTIEEKNNREYNNKELEPGDAGYRSTYEMTDYKGSITRVIKLSSITPLWSVGTCFTYTIVVSLNEIKIIPAYDEWNFDGAGEAVI